MYVHNDSGLCCLYTQLEELIVKECPIEALCYKVYRSSLSSVLKLQSCVSSVDMHSSQRHHTKMNLDWG